MKRLIIITFAVVLAVGSAACSKHDDASSSSATAAVDPAMASPDANAISPEATGTESASPGAESSQVTSSDSDSNKMGVPVYPGAKIVENQLLDTTSNGTHVLAGALSTPDDFDVVDAWYKSRLPNSYAQSHVKSGDTEMSTYSEGSEQTLPYHAIIITRQKGDLETKPSTQIVVSIKEATK